MMCALMHYAYILLYYNHKSHKLSDSAHLNPIKINRYLNLLILLLAVFIGCVLVALFKFPVKIRLVVKSRAVKDF